MNVDEKTIAAELRRLAGAARPVNEQAMVARAVAAARRRRLNWSLAAGALAAAAVAGTLVVVPIIRNTADVTVNPLANGPADLPTNTSAQLQAVRDCMPSGGPVDGMNPRERHPLDADVKDFRELVVYRDDVGSTALVGSKAGFVLCTPQKYKEAFPSTPVFTPWGSTPPGDLGAGVSGPLTVDAYTTETDSNAMSDDDESGGRYRVVAGRVTREVARVEIDWADGRHTDAAMANGFFIGRVPARLKADGKHLDTPPVTLTAYDETGRVISRKARVVFAPLGAVRE
ncbi:hypothetical protein GCM10010116_60360 [Microbispora rosea subsp. aerata]|nr:hypothetical protein [Microbispora rosea]GGO30126.1 hypothetical protein GCM10010116_60360 [Microbispora rosea subsp. aerata]GIH58997.1 hypothetical protein Mro02_59110 [Microbispora rosea subsp. aerata]GLJ87338.1 hypothetical protein GCM10017588_60830 [Microbispora rosea subsp. aerata]